LFFRLFSDRVYSKLKKQKGFKYFEHLIKQKQAVNDDFRTIQRPLLTEFASKSFGLSKLLKGKISLTKKGQKIKLDATKILRPPIFFPSLTVCNSLMDIMP